MRCADKTAYDSEMLAANAAWLHAASMSDCAGVEVYPCRSGADHWHYGHADREASDACRSVKLPPRRRPSRVSGGRRHPSRRRQAAR